MTEMMDYMSTWSALKWVILVLVAGFIGHFGRMFAEAMVARIRKRRAEEDALKSESTSPTVPPPPPQESFSSSQSTLKESSSTVLKPDLSAPIFDKKMFKALAKAKKKEAKLKVKQMKAQ